MGTFFKRTSARGLFSRGHDGLSRRHSCFHLTVSKLVESVLFNSISSGKCNTFTMQCCRAKILSSVLPVLLIWASAACPAVVPKSEDLRLFCKADHDCPNNQNCVNNLCEPLIENPDAARLADARSDAFSRDRARVDRSAPPDSLFHFDASLPEGSLADSSLADTSLADTSLADTVLADTSFPDARVATGAFCENASVCPPGHDCVGAQCLLLRGHACVDANDCIDGHCVDNVCCDQACEGDCFGSCSTGSC